MGVRFVELEDDSRRLIAELVASNGAGGDRLAGSEDPARTSESEASASAGEAATAAADDAAASAAAPVTPAEPVTASRRPAAAASPAPAVSEPHPVPPPPRGAFAASADSGKRRAFWILLALVLAVALAAALWWRPSSVAAPAARSPIEPPPSAPPMPAAPPSSPAVAEPQQLRAVDGWARAWSDQRVDDYFASYSPYFTPAGGLDRETWERQRRTRILAPRWIEVGVAFVELAEIAPDLSRVRFVQAYESDSYADVVRKVLVLERREDGWKILEETVEP